MLICNPVLSRNPFSSTLLFRVGNPLLFNETEYKKRIITNLIKYYCKSFAWFLFYIIHSMTFRISKLRFSKQSTNIMKNLVVINTFMMIDKIYPKGRFDDPDFGALCEIMDTRRKQYVILCFLFGDNPWNLRRRIQTYNILSKDRRNFVTEFELMGCKEWFELLRFIVVYPFLTLELIRKAFGVFDNLLRQGFQIRP